MTNVTSTLKLASCQIHIPSEVGSAYDSRACTIGETTALCTRTVTADSPRARRV